MVSGYRRMGGCGVGVSLQVSRGRSHTPRYVCFGAVPRNLRQIGAWGCCVVVDMGLSCGVDCDHNYRSPIEHVVKSDTHTMALLHMMATFSHHE